MLSKNNIRVLLLVIVGLGVYVFFADPSKGPILPCVFNKITGFYCPGCGMSRAVNSILRFKFYQALRFNALIFIIPIPLILYYVLKYRGKVKLAKSILALMLIIVLGYGVMRNINIFSFLAPKVLEIY